MRRTIAALAGALVVALALPVAPAPAQEAIEPPGDLDLVTQAGPIEADGQFLLVVDVVDAPAGSHIEPVLHIDPVPDRATFNKTLFGEDLGERTVNVPAIEMDDMGGSGDRRRADIGISLEEDRGRGPGEISLTDGLGDPGAYPLDIKLVGPDDTVLDRIITYLVKLPEDLDAVEPLRAAMFFDIHAPPSVGPKGISRLASQDLDRIASVAVALPPHPDAKVTLVPTPETVEALARTEGRPQELLRLLQDAPSGTQVVDGPYVDVPVSSWIAAGMQDELNKQRERGNAVLTEHLGVPDRTTWVASPELTTEAAAELWESGVTGFVLPESTFGALPDDPDAPTPARPFQLATRVTAPVQAVANDSSLAYALGRDDIDDPQLQAQQLVAQLAVIQGEAPDQARGVVFGLEPGKPVSSRVVDETLGLLESNPLVRTATVAEVFSDVEPARNAEDGSVVQRELTPAPSAALGDYPTRLREVQARVASFSLMVTRSEDLLASWQQRLLESGAADLSPDQRNEYIDTIHTTIDRRTAAIQSPPKQSVTLTSNEGIIPFTIRNLVLPRQRVTVRLELQGTSRLEFPGGESQTTRELAPGTNQIRLKVRTRSPGVSPVTIQVTSPDGGLLVTSSRVTVRSTAVSGIGYVLSVGAGLFLVVWWFRHWRRARREHHQVTALPAAGS